MNIHKNARLTPQGRLLAGASDRRARLADGRSGQGGRHLAAAGLSLAGTLPQRRQAALGDRSSAPRCCKHRIGAERIGEITGVAGAADEWAGDCPPTGHAGLDGWRDSAPARSGQAGGARTESRRWCATSASGLAS